MTTINAGLTKALGQARKAMAAPPALSAPGSALMPFGRARQILDNSPSPGLADVMAKILAPAAELTASAVVAKMQALRAAVAEEGLVGEARERLAAVRSALAVRPDPAALVDWLLGLAELVEKAPTGNVLIGEVKAIARNLDVPAACLTDAAMRETARALVWWPSFAKLEPVMLRQVDGLHAERRRLEAIVANAAPVAGIAISGSSSKRPPPTEAEIARNRAAIAAMDGSAEPRSGKRWLPMPKAPVRSVEDQIAALASWKPAPSPPPAAVSPGTPGSPAGLSPASGTQSSGD